MIGSIKELLDSSGNGIYPVTLTTGVYFPNSNRTLDEFLGELSGDLEDLWDNTISDAMAICKQAAEAEIENDSIYVRGAMGVPNSEITEKWIRAQEQAAGASSEHEEQAVSMWKERRNRSPNLKAFNCSGFSCYILSRAGIVKAQKTVVELWQSCITLSEPQNGAIMFRFDGDAPYHCGLYFDGVAYHAKNEQNGVIKEPYDATYWHAYGMPRLRG